MHLPIPEQGRWLASVVRGHIAYYAVPGNIQAVAAFRDEVTRHWFKALRRRSQRTTAQLGADEPDRGPMATASPRDASLSRTCALTPEPKAGAQCGSSARWDLCGGPPARAVPTATIGITRDAEHLVVITRDGAWPARRSAVQAWPAGQQATALPWACPSHTGLGFQAARGCRPRYRRHPASRTDLAGRALDAGVPASPGANRTSGKQNACRLPCPCSDFRSGSQPCATADRAPVTGTHHQLAVPGPAGGRGASPDPPGLPAAVRLHVRPGVAHPSGVMFPAREQWWTAHASSVASSRVFRANRGGSMPDDDTPVLDTLADITAASVEHNSLPPRELMLARLAALIAVATHRLPPTSSTPGPPRTAGSPPTTCQGSHDRGLPRSWARRGWSSAGGKIVRALGFAIAVAEDEMADEGDA